jgi:hypothetical protein
MYPELLAGLNVRRDNWTAVIRNLSRAVELNPNFDAHLFHLSVVFLKDGQLDQYRRSCHSLLNHVAGSSEFHDLDMAAKAALLLPVNNPDFDRACEMADRVATASGPGDVLPWYALCKSLADLRRDRFESAVDWANRAIIGDYTRPDCRAAAFFIQAAAMAKLSQNESAGAALSMGDKIVRQRDAIDRDPFGSWQDWVIAELLRDEAAKVLGIDEPKPARESKVSAAAPRP